MPNLLLTSYKIHDAIHKSASPELSAWLDAHARKWKVQVKWNLPDGDTARLTELAAAFRALLPETKGKRTKAVERLLNEVEAVLGEPVTAVPTAAEVVAELAEPEPEPALPHETIAEPEPEPEPEPGPEPGPEPELDDEPEPELDDEPEDEPETGEVEPDEATREPEEPKAGPETAQETHTEPVSVTNPALVAQITCPTAPPAMRRLEPEARPDLPPPEKRAKVMLGDLFRRISAG
jgi:hypothetical protein